MDHFAGFDPWLRTILGRKDRVTLYGGPGFADQVEHKLRAYTWNLIDETSVDFRLHAAEFDGLRIDRVAVFQARDMFRRREIPPPEHPPGIVLSEPDFRVEAVALDHGIPSLAFGLRETLRVNVRRGILETLGLPKGPWLSESKRLLRAGMDDAEVDIPGAGRTPLGELRDRLFLTGPGQSLAYVTDAAPSACNAEKILALADNVDQFFVEAVFLERDRTLAEASRHLTAREAGRLARAANARRLTVFHHSARYMDEAQALRQEAFAAFGNERVP
jgi:ribonuclease Z